MIPYFNLDIVALGPLKIHVWGLFVALGFLVGLMICLGRAKRLKLKSEIILDLIMWIIVAALIGSRLLYVLIGNELAAYLAKPWLILAIWQGGMTSTGGFLGAAIALLIFYKKRCVFCHPEKRSDEVSFWPYADILAYSFPFGWIIGRVGCFFTHLHPGRLTNFFFAVNLPTGARWEMALMEIMALLPLTILFLIFSRKARPPGFYAIWLMLWYGVMRFVLDFGRAMDLPFADSRYLGLTAAQWGSIILILVGLIFFKKRWGRIAV